MSKSTKIILGIVVLFIVGLTFIRGEQQQKETIKLGGAFGLTGFSSTWGEADKNGALLAIEEANTSGGIGGKQIELIVEDTQSDNAKTLSAVTKLIEVDRVNAIIGPTWLDSYGSASPLADEKNVVMISPSAAITAVQGEKTFKNVFATWYRSDAELQQFPKYLFETNIKSIVIIVSNDSFWSDALNNLKKGALGNNVKILEEMKVDPESSDVRTIVTKAKQLIPDGIFFGFSTEQNLSAFLKQKQQFYPEAKLFTTESIEEFIGKQDFTEYLNKTRFIAPNILQTDFNERYQKRFKITTAYSASNSYDATNMIIEAMRQGNMPTGSIRNYLLNTEFDTVTFGKVRFDGIGGVMGGTFVVKEIIGNETKIIKEDL